LEQWAPLIGSSKNTQQTNFCPCLESESSAEAIRTIKRLKAKVSKIVHSTTKPIAQVRRELRGSCPIAGSDEVLDIIECGGETLDELTIEDLLKLKCSASTFAECRK
jgi:hypothetical protein